MKDNSSTLPSIVSKAEWQQALGELLEKEKELTRSRDALNAARRRMPMVKVEKDYTLVGEQGAVSLLDVFEGRRQLIVYHFMFGPDWQAGCEGCSWVRDAMTHPAHLNARDTTLVMASRAPREKFLAYQERMGWSNPVPWYSTLNSDFNYDFDATSEHGEEHGVSVFLRDGSDIYRTYYSGDRGVEYLGTQWSYLDLTPYGRQESWEDSPPGWPQSKPYEWCNRHDEYPEEWG
ncbi:MAG: DUF899 domain-containing protein [Pseudomonadota bacterium]